MHQACKAAIRLLKKAADHSSVSLIVIIHAKRFLPSNSQISLAFPTFCSFQGWKKVIFLGTSLGSKNHSKNRSRHRGPPQFKNMRGHTCLQGVAHNCSRRCKTMETQRYAKPLSRTRGNNRNLHYLSPGGKILPTKRPPFWGPKTDPKTGAKSPGHKQIKLRLNEWTPFWGPFLDPKTGAVLSAKLLSPSEKKHKFRLFLHVRDKSFPYRRVSMVLQRREYLFSTPCEHLCPHMFLNWGGPPWRDRFC